MIQASRIAELVTDKIGSFVLSELAPPETMLDAINAACRSFAVWAGTTRARIPATFTLGRWTAPSGVIVIEHLEAPMRLFETTFADVLERNPGWSTNTGPAQYWFRISVKELGIDGVHTGQATVIVLEEPTKITKLTDTLDDRIRSVDENAIVLLAAAHLLQNAADGQSLQLAAIMRKEAKAITSARRS